MIGTIGTCRHFAVAGQRRATLSFEQLVADPSLELVLNLTNPRSHYEVTRRCIEAGKHVYSEKPLAMDTAGARELVDLARQKNVYLASAPCSMLSETAQTVWEALREGVIGRVRLVYANFDDGMIAPKLSPWSWTERIRSAMARQGRVRSGLHLRACRLRPDLAGGIFWSGDKGDVVCLVPDSRQGHCG